MNRSAKILAVVLLLALCVSTLGIFSAFAEDATELTPTVIFDMENMTQKSLDASSGGLANEASIGDGKTSPDATVMTDENGDTYWLLETNVAAGETIGTGGAYIQMSPTSTMVLREHTTKGAKNTDFMVIDLDIATDDTFIEYLQFHMRYGNASSATSQDGNGYPQIKGNGYDSLHYTMSKKAGYEMYPAADPDNEWVNVTFVYDFRTETQANWKCHAYMDGYYVGTMYSATKSDAYYYQWLRLSFPTTATADYQSTKLRNLTYTTYPVGWDGDLAAGKIGVFGATLYDIDELAYCFEGTNAARNDVIATVTRGEETIDITSFEQLDANFQEGDVVDLKANINTPLLVNAANVTFNANGYSYSLVDTTDVDFATAKYVVLNYITRAVVASGDAAAFAETGLTDGTIIVMLDDMARTATDTYAYARAVTFDLNGHTITFSGSGRPFDTTKSSGGVLRFANGSFVFTKTTDLTMLNANNAVVFDNINMTLAGGNGGSFIDQRVGLLLFNDSYVETPGYGSKGDTYAQLSSLKGSVSRQTALHIIDTELDCGANGFVTLANYATGGRRVAGLNANVLIKGSDISSMGGSALTLDVYADQTLSIDEEGTVTGSGANKFDVNIDVVDSVITSDYRFIDTNLQNLSYHQAKTTYEVDTDEDGVADATAWIKIDPVYECNDMNIDVDINLVGSEVDCSSVVCQQKSSGTTYDEVTYVYDVAVNADAATKLDASLGVMWNSVNDEHVTSALTLADGTQLANALLARETSKRPIDVITLGAGESVVAYTGLGSEGYNCVVTPTYRAGSYTIKNSQDKSVALSKDFYWNGDAVADPVVIDKVAKLPEATSEYKYTAWVVDGDNYVSEIQPNFTLSANLTALTDFYLNVYLSGTVNPAKVTMTVDGNAVTQLEAITIAGVDYLKAEDHVIKGITPVQVEDGHEVAVSFKGAFGETVTFNASVSIAQHLVKALANTDVEAKAFAQAIINYVVAANAVVDKEVASLAELATEAGAAEFGEAKFTGPAGVEAALNLQDSVRWVFTATAGETYTFAYGDVTRKCTADEDGKIAITIKAVDLLDDIVITDKEGNSGTVNLAGYRAALAALEGQDKAIAVVDALYHYSVAAAAYAD